MHGFDSLASHGILDEAWNRALDVHIGDIDDVRPALIHPLQNETCQMQLCDHCVWILFEREVATFVPHIGSVSLDPDRVDSHDLPIRDRAWHFHDDMNNSDGLIVEDLKLFDVVVHGTHEFGV